MAKAIPGKAYGIRFKTVYFDCQTDLTFETSADITTDEACKPNPSEPWTDANFTTSTVNSKSWTASGTFRATDANVANQNTVLQEFKSGASGLLEIFTFDGANTPLAYDTVISGEAIISSISLNGPVDGNATYDISFTGNGDYDIVTLPVTT